MNYHIISFEKIDPHMNHSVLLAVAVADLL